jgi:hypothetical protein
MVHQWPDTTTGDSYWTQRVSAITGTASSVVKINDTAPTGDRWNLAIVEITSA